MNTCPEKRSLVVEATVSTPERGVLKRSITKLRLLLKSEPEAQTASVGSADTSAVYLLDNPKQVTYVHFRVYVLSISMYNCPIVHLKPCIVDVPRSLVVQLPAVFNSLTLVTHTLPEYVPYSVPTTRGIYPLSDCLGGGVECRFMPHSHIVGTFHSYPHRGHWLPVNYAGEATRNRSRLRLVKRAFWELVATGMAAAMIRLTSYLTG